MRATHNSKAVAKRVVPHFFALHFRSPRPQFSRAPFYFCFTLDGLRKNRGCSLSLPRAKLKENCELRGTDNVQGKISVHIFEAKWTLLCLLSFKYFFSNATFWELLNVKENLSALKILSVCSKCLVLFILTIYSG